MKIKSRKSLVKYPLLLMCLVMLFSLFGCANKQDSTNKDEDLIDSVAELDGKRIGIMTGTIYDAITKEKVPNAEFHYFSTVTDLTSALLSSKIDAFAEDESILKEIAKNNEEIEVLPEQISSVEVGVIFAKSEHGDKLLSQFNEFLSKAMESGLADELYNKWDNSDNNTTMLDYSSLPETNGKVIMATSGMSFPFNFVLNNRVVGYECELIARFCEEYGYGMEVLQMTFDGIISAVQSGKVDMAASGIGYTEERAKQVNYSIPDSVINGFFAVRVKANKNTPFIDTIIDSFNRTFIKEDRWKMFLSGVLITMAITILSIILGTILGFVTYLYARNNSENSLFNRIINFLIWLIHGMPMVVLLMILYYIVFGSISISGFYVAIIGFTLTFACSMYSMLKNGEKAIDKGQKEAAFTLGYNPVQTFYKIILPQAAYHFLPSYKAEIVSLIKATAVVGYIAVQDITKVGDIIRSRTYEAFFPLIVIAIMYFIMAALLTSIVSKIDFIIDPKKRDKNKILKGVKQHD